MQIQVKTLSSHVDVIFDGIEWKWDKCRWSRRAQYKGYDIEVIRYRGHLWQFTLSYKDQWLITQLIEGEQTAMRDSITFCNEMGE